MNDRVQAADREALSNDTRGAAVATEVDAILRSIAELERRKLAQLVMLRRIDRSDLEMKLELLQNEVATLESLGRSSTDGSASGNLSADSSLSPSRRSSLGDTSIQDLSLSEVSLDGDGLHAAVVSSTPTVIISAFTTVATTTTTTTPVPTPNDAAAAGSKRNSVLRTPAIADASTGSGGGSASSADRVLTPNVTLRVRPHRLSYDPSEATHYIVNTGRTESDESAAPSISSVISGRPSSTFTRSRRSASHRVPASILPDLANASFSAAHGSKWKDVVPFAPRTRTSQSSSPSSGSIDSGMNELGSYATSPSNASLNGSNKDTNFGGTGTKALPTAVLECSIIDADITALMGDATETLAKVTSTLPAAVSSNYPRKKSQLSVEGISNFCFPSGVAFKFIAREEASLLIGSQFDERHILQFTDANGSATYCCCLIVTVAVASPSVETTAVLIEANRRIAAANKLKACICGYLVWKRRERWNNSCNNVANSVYQTPGHLQSSGSLKLGSDGAQAASVASAMPDSSGRKGFFSKMFSMRSPKPAANAVKSGASTTVSVSSVVDSTSLSSSSSHPDISQATAADKSRSSESTPAQAPGHTSGHRLSRTFLSPFSTKPGHLSGSLASSSSDQAATGTPSRQSPISFDGSRPRSSSSRISSVAGSPAVTDSTIEQAVESGSNRSIHSSGRQHQYHRHHQLQSSEAIAAAHRSHAIVTRRAYCMITTEPLHAKVFQILQAMADAERGLITVSASTSASSESIGAELSLDFLVRVKSALAAAAAAADDRDSKDVPPFATSSSSVTALLPVWEQSPGKLPVRLVTPLATKSLEKKRRAFLETVSAHVVAAHHGGVAASKAVSQNSHFKAMVAAKDRIAVPGYVDLLVFHEPSYYPTLKEWTTAVLLTYLSPANIIKVMNLLLVEKSLIVSGKQPGVVTAVTLAVKCLITPFLWEGVFVPLVPDDVRELFEAPVPFIAGTITRPRIADVTATTSTAVLILDEITTTAPSSPSDVLSSECSSSGSSGSIWGSSSSATSGNAVLQLSGSRVEYLSWFLQLPELSTEMPVADGFDQQIAVLRGQLIQSMNNGVRSDVAARNYSVSSSRRLSSGSTSSARDLPKASSSTPDIYFASSMAQQDRSVISAFLERVSQHNLSICVTTSIATPTTTPLSTPTHSSNGRIESRLRKAAAAASINGAALTMTPASWKKYIKVNFLTGELTFQPHLFLEPVRTRVEFVEALVNTQLFMSYVEVQQVAFLEEEHRLRNFLHDWIWFRWWLRSKRGKRARRRSKR